MTLPKNLTQANRTPSADNRPSIPRSLAGHPARIAITTSVPAPAAVSLPQLTAAITSPAGGATLTRGTQYTVSVNVSSAGATVTVYRGVTLLGTATGGGTTKTLNVTPDGAWDNSTSLTAHAAQSGFADGDSAPVAVTIADAFTPTSLSGLLQWISADFTTDSGNGTAVSTAQDQSGNAAHMTEASAGMGPIRRNQSTRRKRVLDFPVGAAPGGARVLGTTTASALIGAANGTGKSLTVVELIQPKGIFGATTGTAWGWGHTANASQYKALRHVSTMNQALWSRDTGSNLSLTATAKRTPMPIVRTSRMNGVANTWKLRIDGVEETPITYNDGTLAADGFWMGRWPNGASLSDVSYHFVRHQLVFDRELSDGEVTQIEQWAALEWGTHWKSFCTQSSSFGNGSNAWLIVAVVGQSNAAGQDPATYAGDGTTQHVYALFQDGNLATLSAEPANHNVDSVFGAPDTGLGAGSSFCRRMGEQLRANGETRNIMFVNVACSGTLASDWAGAGLTANPPSIGSYAGQAKHWIDEAIKAPNSEVVFVIYQGEQNSTSAPLAADWPVSWGAFCDEFKSRYAAKIVKTKPFFIVQLPLTGSGASFWGDVRTNQATFCSTTRTDCTLVSAPNGPWTDGTNLHLATSAQNALGILLANAVSSGT